MKETHICTDYLKSADFAPKFNNAWNLKWNMYAARNCMLPKVVQYMVNDKLHNPGNPICVRPLCVLDNGGVSECYIAIVVQVQVHVFMY